MVYFEAETIFSEAAPLSLLGSVPEDTEGGLLYSTSLVPGLWNTIIDSEGEHSSFCNGAGPTVRPQIPPATPLYKG